MRFWISALLCSHIAGRADPDIGDAQCMAAIRGRDWKPIRVKYIPWGSGMKSSRSENLRKNVLPQLQKYLENALSIRDGSDKVYVRRRCLDYKFGLCVQEDGLEMWCDMPHFGDAKLGALDVYECPPGATTAADCWIKRQYKEGTGPLSGGDLFLYVTAELTPYCRMDSSGKPRTKAYTTSCSTSVCGRPNIATINVCDTDSTDEDLTQTLLHEIMHTLGFVAGGDMYGWIDTNGKKQLSYDKEFRLIIERSTKADGSFDMKLLKSIPVLGKWGDIFVQRIPYHVVKSIDARGFGKSSTCQCPIDPNSSFTESQLKKCLLENGLKDCVFVVSTPNVVKYARSYYSCDSLEGMELENQMNHDGDPLAPWTMFNSHWKYKNIQRELMNAILSNGVPAFVSPMTLALLEDSGWYKVNHAAATTSLVEGIMYGYHSGCGLLKEKCVEDGKIKVNLPNAFSLPEKDNEHPSTRCSPDGIQAQVHSQHLQPSNDYVPHQYQYGIRPGVAMMDYCPTYVNVESCPALAVRLMHSPGYNYTNRCIEVEQVLDHGIVTREGSCFSVRCVDNNSFEVYSLGAQGDWVRAGTCSVEHRVLVDAGRTIRLHCPDPKLICAQLNYPHIPLSNINSDRKVFPSRRHIDPPEPEGMDAKVFTTSTKGTVSYTLGFVQIFVSLAIVLSM